MSIELSPQVAADLLKRYLDIGYKIANPSSIKEGATLHKYIRVMKGEEQEQLNQKEVFPILVKVLDVYNTKGAYTIDDAAVIDKVVTYINENVINKCKNEIKEV